MSQGDVILRRISLIDPETATVTHGQRLVVQAGRIVDRGPDHGEALGEDEFDGNGLFLIPGLIDCHVHVIAVTQGVGPLLLSTPQYVGAAAGRVLNGMLSRGFTTVRDAGGADWGLAAAVNEGAIVGPRLLFCERALSQTGGGGDVRHPGQNSYECSPHATAVSELVDSPDAMRLAVREHARRGAHHVKLMAQSHVGHGDGRAEFSDEEVRTAVDEANRWGIPVIAHAFSARRIETLVRLGVRSIEHGGGLDDASAAAMAEHGAFLVPTLGAFRSYAEDSGERPIPPEYVAWADSEWRNELRAIAIATRHGVPVAFGTDLTIQHHRQNEEFAVRLQVQSAADVLRSATSTAARLIDREGLLGTLALGAEGDLVALRANPLDEPQALADVSNIAAVITGGVLRFRDGQPVLS